MNHKQKSLSRPSMTRSSRTQASLGCSLRLHLRSKERRDQPCHSSRLNIRNTLIACWAPSRCKNHPNELRVGVGAAVVEVAGCTVRELRVMSAMFALMPLPLPAATHASSVVSGTSTSAVRIRHQDAHRPSTTFVHQQPGLTDRCLSRWLLRQELHP